MTYLSKYPRNFTRLILGESVVNIGDSFYSVALTLGLLAVYHIDPGELSSFVLIGMLPSMFAFLYGPYLQKIKRTKNWLVLFQACHILLDFAVILCLMLKAPVFYIYIYNFLFSLISCLVAALKMRILPESLDNSEYLINKSVDIQYFAGNTLDILSNSAASVLLGFISYLVLLNVSLPFFVVGMFFMYRLNLKTKEISPEMEPVEVKKFAFTEIVNNLKILFSHPKTAQVILSESFLSGALDLLMALTPFYLLSLHVDLKWIGLIEAVGSGADILGAALAPKVKLDHHLFFCVDYIVSGSAFILLFLVPNIYLKLVLFFFAYVLIGISGNFFEKMIFKQYADYDQSMIYTLTTSFFSIFGIIFLLIPQFYNNVVNLGVGLNAMTVLFGVALYWQKSRK